MERKKESWKERITDLTYDVLEAVDEGDFEKADRISKKIEEILEREEESRKLREEINKDPSRWYNSMVSWYKAHEYMDRAGDMISGSFEDLGYYGGAK